MICITKYTLDDYKIIHKNMNHFDLSQETMNIIDKLSLEVGSPNYSKTPQFRHKRVNNYYVNKNKTLTDMNYDLEMDKAFKVTDLKKINNNDNYIEIIRNSLNKLTNNNYDEIKKEIFIKFDTIVESDNDLDTTLKKISLCFFNIIKNNNIFSSTYAKIYSELINKNSIFFDILEYNKELYSKNAISVEYDNPDDNYNILCEINKINDTKKTQGLFYVNLMKEKVIEPKYIYDLCISILDYYIILINCENKKYECSYLSDLFYILYSNSYSFFTNVDCNYNLTITDIINRITNYKVSDYKSLNNQSIFKFMDIIDEMS